MLTDKIALITGASRGIGAQIAKSFAREGATVIINYNGSKEKAQAVAEEIQADGGTAELYQCSVADYTACGEMIKELIKKYGRIDILVNNAGITRDGLLMKMSEEDFDAVIETNLKGAFHTIRHASRYFLKQKSGKIINISSVSGILGNAGQANYSASKAGVIGLTKSVARELASRGIQANAIAPGFIATDMTDAMSQEAKEKLAESIPQKRIGAPEDIAEMAVFLASSKSDYITGQVFAVDGGMSM
ncbi:MAG: 3-oxoacyl-[acyl-carrier-protein] reductase [Lachnospiraceae bacterium]|nr:3-oxoacyl-[acyl-carrier-protein] reductase [Lachnospiraceae bacterium]